MANETVVTLVGRLTEDLEPRVTKAGKSMATGSLAHTERNLNRQTQQWEDGQPNFYNLTLFDPDASNALSSYKKGDRVIVYGKQQVRNFERKDGSRGTSVDVTVIEMGPSTKFTEVAVNRNRQQNGGGFQAQQPQQQQGGGFQQQGQNQDPWSSNNQQAAQDDPFTNAGPADAGQDNSAGGWW